MICSPAEAIKLLKKLNEELDAFYEKEKESSSFLAALGEDIESVRPKYDFASSQSKIAALQQKILTVKHAINKFNTNTTLPGTDMTLDQVLVCIPELTGYKARLAEMCNVLPKAREKTYGISKNNAIIDYRYANYDITEVQAHYEKISDALSSLQIALDLINTTSSIEFDL